MATKIALRNNRLTSEEEQWLAKNVGPRMNYLHNSIGGQGWLVKREWLPNMVHQEWYLTLEDERLATFFTIKFSA